MTVEVVGIIALALGISSFALRPAFIVYAFIISTLLGASAAFILTAMGGSPISPAHLLLGFFVGNLITRNVFRRIAAQAVVFPNAGFWLGLTAMYGVFSAFFLPRAASAEGRTNSSVKAPATSARIELICAK